MKKTGRKIRDGNSISLEIIKSGVVCYTAAALSIFKTNFFAGQCILQKAQ